MLKHIALYACVGIACAAAGNAARAQTWEDLSAHLPAPLAEQQIHGIVSDGTRLYLLGRRGVLVSADHGASFTVLAQVAGGGPNLDQLVDLALSAIKFVNGEVWISSSGVSDTPGALAARLYRLTPGQTVWQPSSAGFPVQLGNADDIAYDPVSGLYFITHSTGQVSVSTDHGHTWEQRTNGLSGIGSPSSVLAADGVFLTSRPLADVMRSTNQGAHWSGALNATSDSISHMVYHQGRALLWRGTAMDFSDDAGRTWNRIAPALAGVLSSVGAISSDGEQLYAVTRGGLHPDTFAYSASGGLTWQVLTRDGLPPVASGTNYYASGKIIRHGHYLFVHGVTRNASFQFESAKLFRLDVSAFTFTNALQIVLQPQGRGLLVGQSHRLEVYAGGASLAYQWQKNGVDLPGATNRTLWLSQVQLGDAGDYRVLVRSGAGEPAPSAAATVAVFERADGRWDPEFNQTDVTAGGRVHLLPGGEAVVVRTAGNPRTIYRIGAQGGRLQNATANEAADYSVSLMDTDGRIVIGVKPASNTSGVRRYQADTFTFLSTAIAGPNSSASRVRDMVELPGRGYVVVGEFTTFGGVDRKSLALLTYSNTVDLTYAPGTGPNASALNHAAVTPNGDVFAVGQGFDTWNGVSTPWGIVRIDPQGVVHAVNTGVTGAYANVLHGLNDGRLLVLFGTGGARVLYALHSDGTRDTTFNTAGHTLTDLRRVAQQADGKIVLVGSFTNFAGVPAAGYLRLHPNGTVDNSFYCAAGFSSGTPSEVTYDPRGYLYLSARGASSSATFQASGIAGNGPVRLFATPAALPAGFAAWAAQFNLPPGQDGPEDDAAGDGLKNIIVYALGGHPLENNADRLPAQVEVSQDGEAFPGLTFTRNRAAAGVTLDVSASTGLDFAVPANLVETVTDLGGGVERVTLRSTTPLPQTTTFFFHVKVTKN